MALESAIDVKNITRVFKSFKKQSGAKAALFSLLKREIVSHTALSNVSFSIPPSAFVGLVGENGAGKTTLLKILSGLIPPSSGEARVLGFDPFSRTIEFRKNIALVMGQKAQLWWDLPAADAFDLLRAIYSIPKKVYLERLTLLSELLSVQKLLGTQIRRLSLGERMKMELIAAILHWPKVVFLDEPTIGLDILAAHRLREFLREFNQREKATIILTSHNMEDIERLCERVLILRTGSLIYDGPPSGLIKTQERQLRIRLMENPSLEELQRSVQIPLNAIKADSPESMERAIYFSIKQDQIVNVLEKLMKQFSVIDMSIEEQSLESVIHKLYEDGR